MFYTLITVKVFDITFSETFLYVGDSPTCIPHDMNSQVNKRTNRWMKKKK